MNKIVIASDSFKGSLSSAEAADAVTSGIRDVLPDCEVVRICLGDGGEGTAEAIASVIPCHWTEVKVSNPVGKEITARYGVCNYKGVKTAIIELASASGITLLDESQRNPLFTSTFGTGEMILDAICTGCRRFIIGVGGSATNDGGTGMLEALGFRFIDSEGKVITGCNGSKLGKIHYVDASEVPEDVLSSTFIVACDVRTPFCGKDGATRIFAAQKGAGKAETEILEQGMSSFSAVILRQYGINLQDIAGSGAAGGAGGALYVFLKAELRSGAEFILDIAGFGKSLEKVDLVITGEGRIDGQTFQGKLPYTVLQEAKERNIPAVAIGGIVELDRKEIEECGFDAVLQIGPTPRTPDELKNAMSPATAAANIRQTISSHLQSLQKSRSCSPKR